MQTPSIRSTASQAAGALARVCAIAIGILVAACAPAASGDDGLTGRVSVIDGDTLELRGQRIRLWGVDAFESRQLCRGETGDYRCGQAAANALDAQLADQLVSCHAVGRPDRYGRTVARCAAHGLDLGSWLVSNGHALDYPRYSNGRYTREEAQARVARRGAWAGEFEPPWLWRALTPHRALPRHAA